MKVYGLPDPDSTALDTLLAYVDGMDVMYVLCHQRMPVDARPCKLPLSLKVQAILKNNVVVTAFQPAPGQPARIQL